VVFGSLIAFVPASICRQASPAVATSYAFVNPLIAIFLGALFAGEHVTGGERIACSVILIGVFLIFRGKSATDERK
jgi:drug/metabolite transporter (DMT)-like permease